MRGLMKWSGRLLSVITAIALTAGLIDPREFWLPATFGPVLPVLLFLLIGYVAYLAYYRKWKEVALPLAVVILGFPSWQRSIAFSSGTNEVAKPIAAGQDSLVTTSLTALTANLATLKAPQQNNYPIDEVAIVELCKRLGDGDFLFVQEYNFAANKKARPALREYGNYLYAYKSEEGALGILSKHPVTFVEQRFKYNSSNGYLVVDAETPRGKIRLINVHLHSNRITGLANQINKEGKINDGGTWSTIRNMFGRYGRASALRSEQAETIAQIVDKSPYPCIVAGDFNDVPNSYPYRLLVTDTDLQDAWIEAGAGLGKTFAGALPGLRIDYVLADPAFEVQSIEKLAPGHSDHHPLRVVLAWE